MVYKIAFSYMGNQFDAEDAYQNVFLRYLKYKPHFNDLDHERRWFVVTTINVCKSMKKSSWNLHNISTEDCALEEIVNKNVLKSMDEKNEILMEAILKLPEETRLIVQLYYYEEYSVFEISKFLDMKEMAVYARLSRARKSIKKYLSVEGRN